MNKFAVAWEETQHSQPMCIATVEVPKLVLFASWFYMC